MTQDTNTALKPCPFCGSTDTTVFGKQAFTVQCNSCDCESGGQDTPEKAIASWNTRAAPSTGEVWVQHDDDLRFVSRVLQAGKAMTDEDQKRALGIVHGLRTTARSQSAPSAEALPALPEPDGQAFYEAFCRAFHMDSNWSLLSQNERDRLRQEARAYGEQCRRQQAGPMVELTDAELTAIAETIGKQVIGESDFLCWGQGYRKDAEGRFTIPLVPNIAVHYARAAIAADRAKNPGRGREPLTDIEPQWIVNDLGELGVRVQDRFFFLYKGDNLEYESGLHDDGSPMRYRIVGKLEFGETCWPLEWVEAGRRQDRYTRPITFIPGLSYGKPDDGEWRDLPPSHGIGRGE